MRIFSALMDLEFGRASPGPVFYERIKRCEVQIWAIPKGNRPFSMRNWYDGSLLFTDEMRRVFASNYHLLKSGDVFDYYSCNGTR